MSVRFRIRTSAGQELSFASQEMFEDFVHSGELSPDDLVYDGEDGSWAPARTHPIVLDIEYGNADAAPAAVELVQEEGRAPATDSPESGVAEDEEPAAEEPAAEAGESTAPVAEDFGLDLVAPAEISPQEASRQFVERLEAERAPELELEGSEQEVSGFTTPRSSTVARITPVPRRPVGGPPASAPVASHAPEPPRPRPRRISALRRAPPRPDRAGGSHGQSTAEAGGGAASVFGMAVVVAVLGGGGYLGFQLTQNGAVAEAAPADAPVAPIRVEPAPTPPSPDPVINPNEASVRERARERFLAATRIELRSLVEIPDDWPGGRYLALPSASPAVPSVWTFYLTMVRRVRAGDAARYRAAFEAALDDAAISGEDRRIWSARAVSDFRTSAARRDAHYDRVESLATVAIQSHHALLEAEGLLIYDGPEDGLPTEILGAGVTGRDSESNLLLQQVIDLLSTALEADGRGPRSGANVRAWVWDGLLDAVAG
jgi:hypothetical protein